MTSKFTKKRAGGSGAYVCRICGKRTRDTGQGEPSVNACAYCYLSSGLENTYSDGGCTVEEFNAQIAALNSKYGRNDVKPIAVVVTP